MKHATAALFAALALAACTDASTAPPRRPEPARPDADAAAIAAAGRDRYIVVFHDDVDDAPGLANALVKAHGGVVRHGYRKALKGFAARLPAGAVEALRRHPRVAAVDPDQLVFADALPAPSALIAATQTGAPWGLDRIDQRELPLSTTYASDATGAGVTVYIIDSGIRLDHAEFGGRAVSGWDFVDNDADASASAPCSAHGTHVAGIVGGATYGVAKGVRLVSLRVLGCGGSGWKSDVIAAVDWVTANHTKPAVANLSLGGSYYPYENQAVATSIAAGVVYAIAAGNDAGDACAASPGSTPAAITVGWSEVRGSPDYGTLSDRRAYFSNWGTCVDLFAPGEGIVSAWNSSSTATNVASGTSMAAPHVAGVAALHLERTPGATPAEVASTIVASATPNRLDDVGGSPNLLLYYGDSPADPAPRPAVLGLTLYDADTDRPIPGYDPIPMSGATLDLATLSTRNLNVRATTSPGEVGSVRFGLGYDPNHHVENFAPYFLAGDDGHWTPTVGQHSLWAVPYAGPGSTGAIGRGLAVTLVVTDKPTTTPPTGPAVTTLALYDADTDQPLPGYESLGADVTLDLAGLPTRNLNVRAVTDPLVTGSVRFTYDDNPNYRTESVEPYFMAGDEGQWTPTVGTHALTATAYTEAQAGGLPGVSKRVTLRVTDSGTQPPAGPAVVRLMLYNADTDAPLAGYESIPNGASVTIDLGTLATRNLNVRAVTDPWTVGSVRFAYDASPNYRTESVEPYYMAGDEGSWTPTVGTHTISATAYSAAAAGGAAGAPLTITLTVTDQPAGAVAAAP